MKGDVKMNQEILAWSWIIVFSIYFGYVFQEPIIYYLPAFSVIGYKMITWKVM